MADLLMCRSSDLNLHITWQEIFSIQLQLMSRSLPSNRINFLLRILPKDNLKLIRDLRKKCNLNVKYKYCDYYILLKD